MMSSPVPEETAELAAHLLARLRESGVALWLEQGKLHFKAPKGVLTAADLDRLRSLKSQISALLGTSSESVPAVPTSTRRAPVSFAQRMHWQRWQLASRPATRHVLGATRLQGALDLTVLQFSLAQMMRRHDALRTCIVVVDGEPVQQIAPSQPCTLRMRDLTGLLGEAREQAVQAAIEALILEPVDVATGPLFVVELLKLQELEHVLVLAMEHSIADAFSLKVLLRDLLSCYTQALSGRSVTLPPIPLQYADYARWQQQTARSLSATNSAERERLPRFAAVRFPREEIDPSRAWRSSVPVRMDRTLKAQLSQWSRLRGTTLAMSLFAVYSAMVMRWCEVREVVIRYQSDGRDNAQLHNTIGYFAQLLYVPMTLSDTDTLAELIARATVVYCKAYESADTMSHGSSEPEPVFAHNPAFNWIPQSTAGEGQAVTDTLRCSAVAFRYPPLADLQPDHEPGLMLFDTDEEIGGDLYFPARRFRTAEMERFVRCLINFTAQLLRQPQRRITEIPLVTE